MANLNHDQRLTIADKLLERNGAVSSATLSHYTHTDMPTARRDLYAYATFWPNNAYLTPETKRQPTSARITRLEGYRAIERTTLPQSLESQFSDLDAERDAHERRMIASITPLKLVSTAI